MSPTSGGGVGPDARAALDELLARLTADLAALGARVDDVLVSGYAVPGHLDLRSRVEVEHEGSVLHLYARVGDGSRASGSITVEEGLESVDPGGLAAALEHGREWAGRSETVSNSELRALENGLARLDAVVRGDLARLVEVAAAGRGLAATILGAILERGVLFLPAHPSGVRAGLEVLRLLDEGVPLEWSTRHAFE